MVDQRLDGIELGHVAAEDIFSSDGKLLVKEGTAISHKLITKLKKHRVNYRDFLKEISNAYKEADLIPPEEMATSLNAVQTVFENVMSTQRTHSESAIPEDTIELVKKVVDDLMATLSSSEELLYRVSEVMAVDDYTYRHSVNVTVLSILTAKAMGYVEGEIKQIALGALLHDIGKALIPEDVLKKKERLTEKEALIMKDHPSLGYNLVKDLDFLPNSVKDIVHMHHEKMDGSGYPQGLSGLDIPRHVRLVTVCDMYDAMTTTRSYRKKMPLHTALEILMKDSVYKIDPEAYRQMTSSICLFPMGMGVILSDGRVGIVSKYRHTNPTRPVVQIVDFDIHQGEVSVQTIDLAQCKTLFIVDSWDVNGFNHEFKNLLEDEPFYQLPEKERQKYTNSIS